MSDETEHAVVLFDGVCNFCNGAVNFIIERDKKDHFRFAPLQSEIGQRLIDETGIHTPGLDSIVLIEKDGAFTHSTAGLKIAKALGGFWGLAYVFIIVPKFIRDFCYRLFAKYRYRLFGRTDACMMPTPEIRVKFLT